MRQPECDVIIQPTNLAALTWAGAAAGTMPGAWRVGSVQAGRVLDQLALSRYILQIGNVTVEADATDAQALPRQFQARVLSNGSVPLLEIIDTKAEGPLHKLLRAQLPRQGGYAPLLADLAAVARHPAIRELPSAARYALASMEAAIRSPDDLSAATGLKQALSDSGLFFEHALLRTALAPAGSGVDHLATDWKATLLRLSRVLRSMPPSRDDALPQQPPPRNPSGEVGPPLRSRPMQAQARIPLPTEPQHPMAILGQMREHVSAALSRLEIAQLEAHPGQPGPTACLIEIPVQARDNGYDVVQMRIERDANPAQTSEPGAWTLGFSIDLPSLGPIQAEISVHSRQVSVRVWAERHHAVQRLQAGEATLERRMQASALRLQRMQCLQGLPRPEQRVYRPLFEANA